VTLNKSPKSTYETSEERAKKQQYIVRQTSIDYAIKYLNQNIPKGYSKAELFALADEIGEYVFLVNQTPVTELEDDIQY
jgi:hypothetical protein